MRKKAKDQYPLLPIGVTSEQLLKKLHSFEGRIAGVITKSSGSMYFVYFHIIAFTLFFTFRPFDEGIFNIMLSLEAVFLATFIMINQNRQALVDTVRELEEDEEEQQEDIEQEELEEDVEDIQKDLDDIKNAMAFIQQKISDMEKSPVSSSPDKPKP